MAIPVEQFYCYLVSQPKPLHQPGLETFPGFLLLVVSLHIKYYTINMQNQKGLKLLFIINPVSGGKEKHDWEAFIRKYFKDSPHNIEFYLLTGKDDKISIQHHIDSTNPDRV